MFFFPSKYRKVCSTAVSNFGTMSSSWFMTTNRFSWSAFRISCTTDLLPTSGGKHKRYIPQKSRSPPLSRNLGCSTVFGTAGWLAADEAQALVGYSGSCVQEKARTNKPTYPARHGSLLLPHPSTLRTLSRPLPATSQPTVVAPHTFC